MKVLITKDPGYRDTSDVFPFVKTLLTYFDRVGIACTSEPGTGEDIALGIQWVPGLEVVRELKSRGVPFVHRLDGRARSLVKSYDNDQVNRRINELANWTIFQSKYVLQHTTRACDTIFGVEEAICRCPDRGSIIYNGVDREIFTDQGDTESLEGQFNILHIAFTSGIRKGVGDLVRVAELVRNNPKIHFYTIGRQINDHAFGQQLQRLPNVTHLGVIVDRERLARLMRSAQCLFFPSRNDYCPNTVLEGMSCGLPIWYHDSGGTPELVNDEHLVAGVPMIEENPIYPLHVIMEHQQEFSRRAIEMVRRRFTLERMGLEYVGLFEELLRQKQHVPDSTVRRVVA